MNNLRTSVSVLLCCVLLISTPLGFVATASAASDAPDHQVDFCDSESMDSVGYDDVRVAAQEVVLLLPRWYQEVAHQNLIVVRVFDGLSNTDQTSMFMIYIDEHFQAHVMEERHITEEHFKEAGLNVDANCNALNWIISSDNKGDQIVQMIWEGHITYSGTGPGSDAAVVYSKSLLTGAYLMQNGQTGNSGDFLRGTMAPITKTYEELQSTYERFSEPFQDEIRRPGGR